METCKPDPCLAGACTPQVLTTKYLQFERVRFAIKMCPCEDFTFCVHIKEFSSTPQQCFNGVKLTLKEKTVRTEEPFQGKLLFVRLKHEKGVKREMTRS